MNPHKIRAVDQLSGSDVIFGRDNYVDGIAEDGSFWYTVWE